MKPYSQFSVTFISVACGGDNTILSMFWAFKILPKLETGDV